MGVPPVKGVLTGADAVPTQKKESAALIRGTFWEHPANLQAGAWAELLPFKRFGRNWDEDPLPIPR